MPLSTPVHLGTLRGTIAALAFLAMAMPHPGCTKSTHQTETVYPENVRTTGGKAPPIGETAPPTGEKVHPSAAEDVPSDTTARLYRVHPRPLDPEVAKRLMNRLAFKSAGDPEKTRWGALVWHDKETDAYLIFDGQQSEWTYIQDKVRPLALKSTVREREIQASTQNLLSRYLPEKKNSFYFVNHEITNVTARDTTHVCGARPPRPAFFTGRFLTKVDNRVVLGDRFQIRIGAGRDQRMNLLSLREPLLSPADSSPRVPVPSVEAVWKYLREWNKDPGRLGRRIYPYHPDSLRILGLRPRQVFGSYVQVRGRGKCGEGQVQDTTCLVPRVTVVAEAILNTCRKCSEPADCWEMARTPGWKPKKASDTDWVHPELEPSPPHPESPVLLHFNFPCTPEAGLCWPDRGRQMFNAPAAPPPVRRQPTKAPAAPAPIPAPKAAP